MVMSDYVVGASGRGLPKGYRDAMFLRERLFALLSDDAICEHFSVAVNDNSEEMPLSLICATLSAPTDNLENSFHIFPIDLARYLPDQIRKWVISTQCGEVVVVHQSSEDVLRDAGYRGSITLAPIPDVAYAPLPDRQVLRMASIFRSLDSRERSYDPECLMPGYQAEVSEEPVIVEGSIDGHPHIPTKKNLRFRLGATKRHFLNLTRDLFGPYLSTSVLIQDEVDEEDLAHPTKVMALAETDIVFTVVLSELDEESCWVDLVKAFCVAFKFKTDTTLLIFLSGDAREQHAREFDHVLCSLYPFSCRLILVQGVLDDVEYEALMARTNIYVDVNRRAGLRPDLRYFSAAGVLTVGFVVRGDDEALIDFPVQYCNEPSFCDFGDDPRYRTIVRRLDWESLLIALTKGYEQVTSTDVHNDSRIDRISSTLRLEQQKIVWRQALQKHSDDASRTLAPVVIQSS